MVEERSAGDVVHAADHSYVGTRETDALHGSPSTESTLTAIGDDFDIDEINHTDFVTTLSLRSVDMVQLADESQCLNDKIINAAQQLLSCQYTSVSGLYDTVALAASACDVRLAADVNSNTVQIVYDSVKKHWFCVTNKHCAEGHLSIYCSLQLTPSPQCLATVANFFHMHSPSLTINIMNVVKQKGSIDCSLYAIAYADMLASDQDPCNVILDQLQMRRHLIRCLEAKRINSFPVMKHRTIRRTVVSSTVVSLYCFCRSTHSPGEKNAEMRSMPRVVSPALHWNQ